jgi:membrane-associated protease RseP (regulator of RpoE activity)
METNMNKLLRFAASLVMIFIVAPDLDSQDFPKAEIFGGYSYLNVDTNELTSRQNAHGWQTAVSGNFNKWLAAEFDISGYYKNYTLSISALEPLPIKFRDYSYLAGPRLNFRPFFVHALLGGDHLSASALGSGASQDGFAGAFGGGVIIPIKGHIGFRFSADYVFSRHNVTGGPSVTQNNMRASAGIVFTFGGRTQETAAIEIPKDATGVKDKDSRNRTNTRSQETKALGVVGYPTAAGFEVVSVTPASVASRLYLRPGDVIVRVNDAPASDASAIDAAVQAGEGKVRVNGLTRTILAIIPFERETDLR